IFRSARGLWRRRFIPGRTASPATAASGLREGEHSPHPAPPAWIRSQLLLHLHFHGRPSALACRAPESLILSAGSLRLAKIRLQQAVAYEIVRCPRPGFIGVAAKIGVHRRDELPGMDVAHEDGQVEY